jgi:hypothetical protein
MLHTFSQQSPSDSRVLIVSLRGLKSHVSRASVYELEDTIRHCDSVDVLELRFSPRVFKVTNTVSNEFVRAVGGGRFINSLVGKTYTLHKDYEIMFFFCQSVKDLLVLNAIKNWRS